MKASHRQYSQDAPNDFPMYGVRDASRYLKIPTATLRSWFAGTNQGKFRRVLSPAAHPPLRLSFNNLAEAFVLHNLRTEHGVQLEKIRRAIAAAERQLGIERLLLNRSLKAHAGEVLLEKFGQYLTLGQASQYAMKVLLEDVLTRFLWEDPNFPSTLFPYVPRSSSEKKIIALNPRKSFGTPYLTDHGITTAVIVSRFEAGETIPALAEDYKLEQADISAAIVYEQAA